MATESNRFNPDYATPPGWLLEEYLETREFSQAEFARRCGRSAKMISEIIAGKAPVGPDTAIQFQRVLGMDASIWLGIEENYRLHLAKKNEERRAVRSAQWLKGFPVEELVKRGLVERPESGVDAYSKLLTFFGVGSTKAWNLKYGSANVAYLHSRRLKSDEKALASWLRIGELEAQGQECAHFDAGRFRAALKEIRRFTREPMEDSLPLAKELCNRSGVALSVVEPLASASIEGAAWWLSPRKALIMLGRKRPAAGDLWFCFFHEAAHLLLHSKKGVFIDGGGGTNSKIEKEANNWAVNALVRRSDWESLVSNSQCDGRAIAAFADSQGIAREIVAEMFRRLVKAE